MRMYGKDGRGGRLVGRRREGMGYGEIFKGVGFSCDVGWIGCCTTVHLFNGKTVGQLLNANL